MRVRILVVDDATFIRDMVKKQLRDKIPGVEIIDAPDGMRAMAAIKNQTPDIILSDWEMPNMTGAELLSKVRAMPGANTVPFIMISSRGDRNHIIKAIELGVSDYLTKPFTADELLKKVLKQLKILGKTPTAEPNATTQGIAHASVNVLTAKRVEPATARVAAATGSANVLLNSTPPATLAASNPKISRGTAQLRFANNRIFACVIREMSLQSMSCIMQRNENLPGLFEQAVVDIETGGGENLARVNGYVHSIQAGESRPDTTTVKIVIRFVDNDGEKFEALSKYIAQL